MNVFAQASSLHGLTSCDGVKEYQCNVLFLPSFLYSPILFFFLLPRNHGKFMRLLGNYFPSSLAWSPPSSSPPVSSLIIKCVSLFLLSLLHSYVSSVTTSFRPYPGLLSFTSHPVSSLSLSVLLFSYSLSLLHLL